MFEVNLKVEFPTRRGTLVAVDGVSFSIAPGEVLGVVGESGAGKSITGLAVIGLLEPPGRIAGGEVRLEGRRIDDLPHEEMRRIRGRRIGMVFQDPLTSLNPLYTVGRQLEETILTHLDADRAQARERALALLAEVGIPAPRARFHHYPHQFSGGMRQRVVIALALAAEPVLMIADEPTTALDVSIQAQIIALLKRLAARARRGGDADHARHGRDRRDRAPRRGDVRRPHRRDRPGARRDPLAAASLHRRPDGLDPENQRCRTRPRLVQIDGAMPRLNAIPPGCAFNPALPEALRALHGGAAGPDARTARAKPRAGCMNLLELEAVSRDFDVSRPWLNRVLEGEPRRMPARGGRRELRGRSRARPSRWSASRAAASRRWRG